MTTVDREEFLAGLRAVRAAMGSNPALPVLNNVSINCDGTTLILIGTNLETFARREVAFSGDPLPPLTVTAKTLADFVAGLSGDEVQLTFDKRLTVKSGRNRATFATIKSTEFPVFPSLTGDAVAFTLSRIEYDRVANRITPFAATDQARPILTGVSVVGDGEHIRFAAADNYRLATLTIDHKAILNCVIPAATITKAGKVLEGNEVIITVASNGVMFSSDVGVMLSRIIDGQFPNLESVVPTSFKVSVLVDQDELVKTAKLAGIAQNDRIKLELIDSGLRVHSFDSETDFDAVLPATVAWTPPDEPEDKDSVLPPSDVSDVVSNLNTKFLLAVASALGESTAVEIGYNQTLAPVRFKDPDDPSFIAIVMPIRSAA